MSSNAFKPENALKRADELILVGQSSLAFQNLHDLIMSKRLRFSQMNYESIMLRYITLAVNMRKGKYVKEALSQYRNQTIFSNLQSFELVIRRFVETAENKIPSGTNVTSEVEDLDSSDTPESMIEKILNGDDEPDSTHPSRIEGEDTTTPFIRFLWEAYRISLDIVRNNSKLESFYRFVAIKAFEFCGKFGRKTEFRRLCEVLRNHLIQITKGSSSSSTPHISISLLNSESMNMQMQIRFVQLNTAMQLEVWPEALKSIEDIYELLCLNKKGTVDHQLMIKYYEALTKIFRVSGNSLFHAAAWNKYLSFVGSQSSSIPHSQLSELTSCTLLSALSVPIHISSVSPFSDLLNESVIDSQETQLTKDSKITAIMGLSKIPTRDQLIVDASSQTYWNYIDVDVKFLYETLSSIPSSEDSPLELSRVLSSTLSRLNSKPIYAQFMSLVQKTIFSILFERVIYSLTYISYDDLLTISSNVSLSDTSLFTLELSVLQESIFYSHYCTILIDDMTKCFYVRQIINLDEILLPSSYIPPSTSGELCPIEETTDIGETSLVDIENKLSSVFSFKSFFSSKNFLTEIKSSIFEINFAINKQQILIQSKKENIIRAKHIQDSTIKAKESREALERAEKLAFEQELHRTKRAEQLEQQEQERRKNELLEIQLKEKRKLIDQVIQKISMYNRTIDPEAFMKLPREEILNRQAEILAEGKSEIEKKAHTIAKRLDHLERAFRQEELVLLKQDYEIQKKIDQETYNSVVEKKRVLAQSKHFLQIASIKSASSRLQEANSFFISFKEARLTEIAPEVERMTTELMEAKKERFSKAVESFLLRKHSEETLAKKQAEDAEIKSRFMKQEEIQRAREAEIELKLEKQLSRNPLSTTGSHPSSSFSSSKSFGSSSMPREQRPYTPEIKGVSKFPGKKAKELPQ